MCLPPYQNIKTLAVCHMFFFEVGVNFRFWCTSPSPTWPEVFKLFFDMNTFLEASSMAGQYSEIWVLKLLVPDLVLKWSPQYLHTAFKLSSTATRFGSKYCHTFDLRFGCDWDERDKSWVPELSEVCADMVDVSKMTIVLADLDFKKMTFTKLLT